MDRFSEQLRTKIRIPKTAGGTLRRQRLIDHLHRNLDAGVLAICAPAGYGKTTLIADFCADLDVPVCWYSIDGSDADLEWFIKGIVASVRLKFPGFGHATESSLGGGERRGDSGISRIADALVRDMQESIHDYFLLVLEDYHVVQGTEIDRLTDRLIELMPENCHVIMSARTSLEIPGLSARVVRGQASVLTAPDLTFIPSEIMELAHQKGLVASDSDIDRLSRETEGWIVGLLLQLHGTRSGRQVEGFTSMSREDVFSYLASEVYEQLPDETKGFLLKSSVLDEIDPEFCDRLLAGAKSQKILRELQRRGLFISVVQAQKPCYRYHPLFRDFLRERLIDDDPVQFYRVHDRAATLYKEDRRWQEAIEHFVAARRYSKARELIESAGQDLLKMGQWASVARWIEALPARFRDGDGELLLLQAQCGVHVGSVDESARALTRVIAGAGEADAWLRRARALSWRSAAHRLAGHLDQARTDITTCISLLEENSGPADTLGDAHRRLGLIYLERGRLSTAVRHLKKALKHYQSVFDLVQAGAVHNSLGIAYRELGDLAKAGMHLDLARQCLEKAGNTGALASLLNNLGLVYQCQGDYERALKTLLSGLKKARESQYRRMEACILISTADVLRDICLYDDALSTYEEGRKIAEEVMELYYVTCAIAGIGETHRLLGAPEKAEVFLRQAVSQAEEHGRTYEGALFSVRLGIIEYERGQYEKARSILSQAVSRIKKIGDQEALSRTYFHMAHVLFLSRDYRESREFLLKASRLADKLGYDSYFTVEGRNAVLLLQYGASEDIGEGRFVRALEGVKRSASASLRVAPEIKTEHLASPRPAIRVYAFGESRVLVNDRRLRDTDWRSSRARELFYYLLCSDVSKSREQIAVDLWPDLSPAKSTSNFHISLYRIRHALFPNIVVLQEGRYHIDPDVGIWFDAAEFSDAVDRVTALPLDTAARVAILQKAVDHYSAPFLPNVYSEWAETRRRALEAKYLKAMRLLAISYGEIGDFEKALGVAGKIAAIDPYDEDLFSEIEVRIRARGPATALLRQYRQRLERLRDSGTGDNSPTRALGPGKGQHSTQVDRVPLVRGW